MQNENIQKCYSSLREPTSNRNIIKQPNGTLDVATEAIVKHSHSFYTNLYNLPPQHRQTGMIGDRTQIIQDYLDKSGLPALSDLDATLLEGQIEASEIRYAIKDLKSGKSPGPEGFASIYYKTVVNIITDPLAKALNSLSMPREVTPDFRTALITVISNPNKDS